MYLNFRKGLFRSIGLRGLRSVWKVIYYIDYRS